MDDYRKEIEGTLARTKERKNTILYKLYKRNRDEDRLASLGISQVPTNPMEVNDPKVVKFVLFRLKQELGDKIARIRNPQLMSIEKDGECVVRAHNEEINRLIGKVRLWEKRQHHLEGEKWTAPRTTKSFFGCAKDLPEAKEEVHGSEGTEAEITSPINSTDTEAEESDNEQTSSFLSNPAVGYYSEIALLISDNAGNVVEAERATERAHRSDPPSKHVAGAAIHPSVYVSSYCPEDVPSEEYFRNDALNARKKKMRERIQAAKSTMGT